MTNSSSTADLVNQTQGKSKTETSLEDTNDANKTNEIGMKGFIEKKSIVEILLSFQEMF